MITRIKTSKINQKLDTEHTISYGTVNILLFGGTWSQNNTLLEQTPRDVTLFIRDVTLFIRDVKLFIRDVTCVNFVHVVLKNAAADYMHHLVY